MAISPDATDGVANGTTPLPNVATGGQPTPEQLERLKAAGVKVVVDLRDPMEQRPFDEPAKVRDLGLEYVNVPVRPGATSDEQLDRVREALRNADEKPVFLHCATANRVGGALLPHLILDQGLPEEQAVERAMQVGLRSPEFLEWGLGYAQRKKQEE
jgi:protein tyrosine phosphatase (PTP) superfamily phosphohydrolase (DUF442 family)